MNFTFSSPKATLLIEVSKLFSNLSITSLTSISGTDAPEEIPIFILSLYSLTSSSFAFSNKFDFGHPAFFATSTNLLELEEFCEPTTIKASHSPAKALIAFCLLVVA